MEENRKHGLWVEGAYTLARKIQQGCTQQLIIFFMLAIVKHCICSYLTVYNFPESVLLAGVGGQRLPQSGKESRGL